MGRLSIVEYCGDSEHSVCGYCQKKLRKEKRAASTTTSDASDGDSSKSTETPEKGTSFSFGVWAHVLTCPDYQCLLDRGWRRSGHYLYKPDMAKTCCPQYTIRLDVTKFRMSGTQKKVMRQMNEFLKEDKRPSGVIREEANASKVDKPEPMDTNAGLGSSVPPNKKQRVLDEDVVTKKKKVVRRERAIERWKSKGLNVEEMQRKRAEREENRVRTVRSYVEEAREGWKHKLEVRLVHADSAEFKERSRESFELYDKYQRIIHNDDPSSPASYARFLVNSPLIREKPDHIDPPFGSYHQHYILDGKLIAVGVVDLLPRCYSSKYLYYDPDYAFLSLGTYTALREIDFVQHTLMPKRPALRYYYMGYYIESCPKMRYKGKFRPSDLLCDRSFDWAPLSECTKMLAANEGKFTVWRPDLPAAKRLEVANVSVYYDGKVFEWDLLKVLHPELNKPKAVEKLQHWADHVGQGAERIVLFSEDFQKTNANRDEEDA